MKNEAHLFSRDAGATLPRAGLESPVGGRREYLRVSRSQFAFWSIEILAIVAFVMQVMIQKALPNLISAGTVLVSTTLTLYYLRGSRAFEKFPLSSFSILGLCVTTQWGALLAQSFSLVPIAENLHDAQRTFFLLGAFQMIAIVAHATYRGVKDLVRVSEFMSKHVALRIGIFHVPSPGNLWIFGIAGFLALFVSGSAGAGAGVLVKLTDGLRFLVWAPFTIIPIYLRYGDAYCDIRKQKIGLGCYVIAAIGLGMALNARSLMLSGVVTVVLLLFMQSMRDNTRMTLKQMVGMVAVAVLATSTLGYAADVATAMVLARSQRGHITPIEMLEQTVYALMDTNAIEAYRDMDIIARKIGSYDEYYIVNPIVARFVETKFHDNMFFLIRDLSPSQIALVQEDTINKIVATLPDPALQALHIDLDKESLQYSSGDYFDYLVYGNELGGYKTGSMFANFMAVFGDYAYAVFFVICLATYICWDSFVMWEGGPPSNIQVSPMAMLMIWGLFLNGLSIESINNVMGMFLRGFPEHLLFYSLLLALSSIFYKPFRRVKISEFAYRP